MYMPCPHCGKSIIPIEKWVGVWQKGMLRKNVIAWSVSELIVHGKTGFLVNDAVNEMVHYIPQIDEIDRKMTRMHVERNFSASVMAEKYVRIYNKVITMSKGVPL